MAVALDMQVVAEGVETLAQLDLLKKIGCHEIQGHIISPALPAKEIELLMQKTIMPPFDQMTQLAVV
jgi:EAL domain-containing protein (putative c-di-GMP-specific phosphodiesterase class I)